MDLLQQDRSTFIIRCPALREFGFPRRLDVVSFSSFWAPMMLQGTGDRWNPIPPDQINLRRPLQHSLDFALRQVRLDLGWVAGEVHDYQGSLFDELPWIIRPSVDHQNIARSKREKAPSGTRADDRGRIRYKPRRDIPCRLHLCRISAPDGSLGVYLYQRHLNNFTRVGRLSGCSLTALTIQDTPNSIVRIFGRRLQEAGHHQKPNAFVVVLVTGLVCEQACKPDQYIGGWPVVPTLDGFF